MYSHVSHIISSNRRLLLLPSTRCLWLGFHRFSIRAFNIISISRKLLPLPPMRFWNCGLLPTPFPYRFLVDNRRLLSRLEILFSEGTRGMWATRSDFLLVFTTGNPRVQKCLPSPSPAKPVPVAGLPPTRPIPPTVFGSTRGWENRGWPVVPVRQGKRNWLYLKHKYHNLDLRLSYIYLFVSGHHFPECKRASFNMRKPFVTDWNLFEPWLLVSTISPVFVEVNLTWPLPG